MIGIDTLDEYLTRLVATHLNAIRGRFNVHRARVEMTAARGRALADRARAEGTENARNEMAALRQRHGR